MINLEHLVVPESKERQKTNKKTKTIKPQLGGYVKGVQVTIERVHNAQFRRNDLSNKIFKVLGSFQPVFFDYFAALPTFPSPSVALVM